jgi:DNA-3-methyladenine glycosylase
MLQPDPLQPSFFSRPAADVARDLIGCTFLADGVGGRIVETEAYDQHDPSSHTYRGRTRRNAVMFGPPAHLYVYLIYGMHHCANIACGEEGFGAGVLLRALEPLAGLESMAARRGTAEPRLLCSGPARLTHALDITLADNGLAVNASRIGLFAAPASATPPSVVAAPRINVRDPRPWRFLAAGSRFVSRSAPRQSDGDRMPGARRG